MQYFPDDKTSNFVTKFSRTLQLDGEWEVGIAEIDYPHTWYNIREGKSQYHGDVVVPVLRTVTVKGEHGKNVLLNMGFIFIETFSDFSERYF